MAFTDAVTAILDALKADAALSAVVVKDYPPDAINRALILLVYPRDGTWGPATMATFDGTADLRVALHKKRLTTEEGGLETTISALLPYYDAVPRCLLRAWAANRFANTVQTIGHPGEAPLRCEPPGPDNWSGVDTVSIRWSFTITPNQEDL